MSSLPKRLWSVCIAVPLTVIFFFFLDMLGPILTESAGTNLSPAALRSASLVSLFAVPAFLLVGIPVSYGVDYVAKKIKSRSRIQTYLVKLAMYAIVAILIIMLTFERGSAVDFVQISGIIGPVLIGFHTLYAIRREYRRT